MRPCPVCGSEKRKKIKSWDATPKKNYGGGHIRIYITIWECQECGHRYRTAERTWKEPGLLPFLRKTSDQSQTDPPENAHRPWMNEES